MHRPSVHRRSHQRGRASQSSQCIPWTAAIPDFQSQSWTTTNWLVKPAERLRGNTHKVTLVVSLAAIITQKTHRVAVRDMLRVLLHELLHRTPQARDGVVVLVQTQHKAVLLVVFFHVAEWVKADITEELNAGLHAPVVLIVQHQWVPEEESGFITAHVTVALRVAVDDLLLSHLLSDLLRLLLVDPLGI